MNDDDAEAKPVRRDPFSRQSRVLGWVLLVLGFVIAAVFKIGGQIEGRTSLLLGVVIIGVGGAVGFVLSRRAGRHFARSANEVLAHSNRPPVLYLRKFDDEDEGWEHRIVRSLERVGPVVAIGDPRDRLPAAGAFRLYAADDDWQTKVIALIESSALIVLKAGDTMGIRWEVQQVLSRASPSRVLLFLPMAFNGKRVDQRRYRAFLDVAGEFFPKPLPSLPDLGNVIYFENDWTPLLVSTWKSAQQAAASERMRTDNRRTALEGLATNFHDRLKRRDVVGIGLLLAVPAAIFIVPWTLRALHEFTWWGLKTSERDLVDRARPKIEHIAASLRKTLTSNSRSAPSGPDEVVTPVPVYGPPAASPNTDILTKDEVLWLVGDVQAIVGPRLYLSTSLVWAVMDVRRYDPAARSRRPSDDFVRRLQVGGDLVYVAVVALGDTRLGATGSADEWRVAAACDIRLVRTADGSEAVSARIDVETSFKEVDESQIGRGGPRRPGEPPPPAGYDGAQFYELFGWRVRRARELADARERFARQRMETAARKAILDELARLTGGRFDGT